MKFGTFLIIIGILGVSFFSFCLFNPGPVERFFSPNWGTCGKCNRPWNHVKKHDTTIVNSIKTSVHGQYLVSISSGMFPLCEQCWIKLETAEARLPYYRKLYDRWGNNGQKPNIPWEDIERSVFYETTVDFKHIINEID